MGAPGCGREGRRVTLFSGFVSYEQLRGAFLERGGGGGGMYGGVMRMGGLRRGRTLERIVMAGPGGRGAAEVAVFEPGTPGADTPAGDGPASRGRVRGSIGRMGSSVIGGMGAALSAGSGALRGMVGRGGSGGGGSDGGGGSSGGGGGGGRGGSLVSTGAGTDSDAAAMKLQCCLMSVCLPWDQLAHDILFKPPSF